MISVTIFLPRFSASSVQSFVKTSSILVYIHHPLHPLERILTKNAGFPEAGGKKKKEGEKKRKERRSVGWMDYRISGRANKTRVATKIFVSRGPIKPISASGMCFVFHPRENNFDYFSGYAMVHRLRSRNFRRRNCATVRTGNEFPAEGNASRGFTTSCTVIGKVSGDG